MADDLPSLARVIEDAETWLDGTNMMHNVPPSRIVRDLLAAVQHLRAEVAGGHARLNECVGWEATRDLPLYERISRKIQQLADDKAEVQHMLIATGHEKDELQARAGAAESRRLAAEYRAQRIVLDAELKARADKADADLTALRSAVRAVEQEMRKAAPTASARRMHQMADRLAASVQEQP